MSILEESVKIGTITVPNRIARSATHESLANNGKIDDRLIDLLGRLAIGRIGLIFTSAAAIDLKGKIGPTQMGIYDDEFVPNIKNLVQKVHSVGNSKIIIQVSHAGPHARGVQNSLAPSAIKTLALQSNPKEMSKDEICGVLELYQKAALRVRSAGADGIQFHMCHGDLPSSFFSKKTNKRKDEWGGSLENRIRFPQQIYQHVREVVGKDFLISIKLNATDYKGGWNVEDAILFAKRLGDAGINAIEVSAGVSETWLGMSRGDIPVDMILEGIRGGKLKKWLTVMYFKVTGNRFPFQEGYLLDFALKIKKAIPNVPIISVGGYRSKAKMEEAIKSGIDMISLSRPLIRDPNFVKKMLEGNLERSDCKNCNRCVIAIGFQEKPLKCYYKKIER